MAVPPDLLARVRRLDAEQLAELQNYLRGLLQQTTPERRASGWLAEALQDQCQRLGLGGFLSADCVKALKTHQPYLEDYLRRSCPSATVAQKRAIAMAGLGLLYGSLAARKLPVTATVLAKNLGALPAAIDHEFPGYAASGLLGMLFYVR